MAGGIAALEFSYQNLNLEGWNRVQRSLSIVCELCVCKPDIALPIFTAWTDRMFMVNTQLTKRVRILTAH